MLIFERLEHLKKSWFLDANYLSDSLAIPKKRICAYAQSFFELPIPIPIPSKFSEKRMTHSPIPIPSGWRGMTTAVKKRRTSPTSDGFGWPGVATQLRWGGSCRVGKRGGGRALPRAPGCSTPMLSEVWGSQWVSESVSEHAELILNFLAHTCC